MCLTHFSAIKPFGCTFDFKHATAYNKLHIEIDRNDKDSNCTKKNLTCFCEWHLYEGSFVTHENNMVHERWRRQEGLVTNIISNTDSECIKDLLDNPDLLDEPITLGMIMISSHYSFQFERFLYCIDIILPIFSVKRNECNFLRPTRMT